MTEENKDIPKSISFSALKDWQLCSWYYFLRNIKRLDQFKDSVDTIYGKIIHKFVQDVLDNKQTVEAASKLFERTWNKFCGIYGKYFTEKDNRNRKNFFESGLKIIASIQEAFQKEFGNYKVVEIEKRISATLDQYPQRFNGFLDIIIQLEDGKYVVADFKKSNSLYFFDQNQDKFKEYQLTLYKHFLSNEKAIDPDDIKTYFVVLETNPNKKGQVTFIYVSSGKQKIKNALEWLHNALSAINDGWYVKKRTSCNAYGRPCVFLDTVHCPKSLTNNYK